MPDKLCTIILEVNELNKINWSIIYSIINSIEKNSLNIFSNTENINLYFVADSSKKKRIRIEHATRLTKTNSKRLENSSNIDYLILYNKSTPNKNFSEYIPFFNLIDTYGNRVSLGINLNTIIPSKEQDNYKFSASQFFKDYKSAKNIRTDQQIYFLLTYIDKVDGKRKYSSQIVLKIDYSSNVSKEYSSLIRFSEKVFFSLFYHNRLNSTNNNENEGIVLNIRIIIEKYNREFDNKLISNKVKSNPDLSKKYNSIFEYSYSNLFSEYIIKAVFFHLQEIKEFSKIKSTYNTIYLLEKYCDGIEELIQNIVYHTEKKIGYLAVCFKKATSEQKEMLRKAADRRLRIDRILEIEIMDFASRGLLDTFDKKGISIIDLFDTKSLFEDDTDLDVRYAAHTGLKIFQKYIANNFGNYYVETSSASSKEKLWARYPHHINHESEDTTNAASYINGTHYKIQLPISDQIIIDIPPDNLVTFQSKPLDYRNLLSSSLNEIQCQKSFKIQHFPVSKPEQIKQIESIGNSIIEVNKGKSSIAFNFHSLENIISGKLFFKLMAYLQLRNTTHFQIIIVCNIPHQNSFIPAVKERIEGLLSRSAKAWNKNTALILLTENNIPYILSGESASEITLLNNQIRIHYPSENFFSFIDNSPQKRNQPEVLNESNRFFQPYELLVHIGRNNLFENYVSKILENDIEKGRIGYKLQAQNILIGSKIVLENFYEADTLFQNSFFVDRFALIIVKKIISLRKEVEKDFILIGYASFSEFLIVRVKSFLEMAGISVAGTVIAEDIEKDEWLIRGIKEAKLEKNLNNYVIATIVPIGSTLSTNDKILSKFIHYYNSHNFDISKILENTSFNFCMILVRDSLSKGITEEEEMFWDDCHDKTVSTKFKYAKQVHYFIEKQGNWNNVFDESVSFPSKFVDEKPVMITNKLSINSKRAIGWPIVRNIAKDDFNVELSRLKSFNKFTSIGHFNMNKSHLHYYFETNSYIRENHSDVEDWLDTLKSEPFCNNSELNVILTPSNNLDHFFLEMINSKLFNDNAFIIYIDIQNDLRNNIKHKYSFLKQLVKRTREDNTNHNVKFHFVDHVLSTGQSARTARSYISSILEENRTFESLIVLINRLSYYKNKELCGYKNPSNVYQFINLFIPPIKSAEKQCSICRSTKYYKKLKQKTSIDKLMRLLDTKINKLKAVNLKTTSYDFIPSKRKFQRLILTHEIYHKISTLLRNSDSFNKITDYLKELGKSGDISFKINFVKVLSTQPLEDYQHIKSFIFKYMLAELNIILHTSDDNIYSITSFNYLLVLLQSLAKLGSNCLIRKTFIVKVWEYYFKFLEKASYKTFEELKSKFKILSRNLENLERQKQQISQKLAPGQQAELFQEDLLTLTQEINEAQKSIKTTIDELNQLMKFDEFYSGTDFHNKLDKQSSNIENFDVLMLLFVNTCISRSEPNCLWLGDLLRYGEEKLHENEMKLSEISINNSLFTHFQNQNGISSYKNFLSWIGYDNSTIFRITLKRLDEEIKKNKELSNFFYTNAGTGRKLVSWEDFYRNSVQVQQKITEIFSQMYYYQYIEKYLTLQSINVLEKLILVLYTRLFFREAKESSTENLTEKVNQILKVFSSIMEAEGAFLVLSKPSDSKYRVVCSNFQSAHKRNLDLFKDNFNQDSYTSYQLKAKKIYYPIVSNSSLVDRNNYEYGEKKSLNFNRINVYRLYNKANVRSDKIEPFGALTFLYEKKLEYDSLKFSVYSQQLGCFLMLLNHPLRNFLNKAYNEHSISNILDNIITKEKFKKIFIASDHRYNTSLVKGVNEMISYNKNDPTRIKHFVHTLLSLYDATISWLFSIISLDKNKNLEDNDSFRSSSSFYTVFSNVFIAFIRNIPLKISEWEGQLEIVGFDIEQNGSKNNFHLPWNTNILQAFIVLLLKNSMYSHRSDSDKRTILSFDTESKSISIISDCSQITEERKIHKMQIDQEEFKIKKVLINNLQTEDYSCTTLTSLRAYCNYLNLELDFGYRTFEEFYVKFSLQSKGNL